MGLVGRRFWKVRTRSRQSCMISGICMSPHGTTCGTAQPSRSPIHTSHPTQEGLPRVDAADTIELDVVPTRPRLKVQVVERHRGRAAGLDQRRRQRP
eukprot:692973-Prymnesium_polylepis.1